MDYDQFLKILTKQELLSVRIYRSTELSIEKMQALEKMIAAQGISDTDYQKLTQTEKEKNKTFGVCSRCYSAKTNSDLKEKYPDFRTLYLAWPQVGIPSCTRNCYVCAHTFKQKVPFSYYFLLFRKRYL